MIPAGYMAKKIARNPDPSKSKGVKSICSVSGCISNDFSDYVEYWKHNKFWFFDSPEAIFDIIKSEHKQIADFELHFYEIYEKEFDGERNIWKELSEKNDFSHNIKMPSKSIALGFDIVCYNTHTMHECSPLSCNNLSASVSTNEYCLMNTLNEAKKITESLDNTKGEPGPYRIIKVNKVITQ